MSNNIEVIALLIPKNGANFSVADVNDLKGGYIQVETTEERDEFLLYTNRLKEGMLCYVKETRRFFLLLDFTWKTWQPSSGATMEITTVSTLAELEGTILENRGLVVFVDEYDTLFYYTGVKWSTFSRIYVLDFPPEDTGSIWIDTSDVGLNNSSSIANELYRLINILARKIHKLEYREQQIQSGEFSNNMYNLYDEVIGIDPKDTIPGLAVEEDEESDATDEKTDYSEEQLLLDSLISDAEEPKYYKDSLPNVKHIQIKWGTYSNMLTYKDNFLPAELLFCYNTNELYIKHPKTLQLIKIGATGGGGPVDPDIEDVMNGIIQDGNYIGSIAFVDMTNPNKHWVFGVENGEVNLYNEELNTDPAANGLGSLVGLYYKLPYYPQGGKPGMNTAHSSLLFINMIYGSGNNVYDKYNPCNFNFIELSNIDIYHDVNLNGYYLHYSEGYTSTTRKWITLPLKGVIKAGSTYLIKCARSGDDKFARINVGTPDIYFSKGTAKNIGVFDSNNYSVWDADGMLKINNNCAFLLTGPFYNTTDSDKYTDKEYSDYMLTQGPYLCDEPWKANASGEAVGLVYGFCDLAGFGKAESKNMPLIAGNTIAALSPNTISVLYYSMDNVSLAYKAQDAANKPSWTTINLLEPHLAIEVAGYTPRNSKEGKNIFFNKHLITEGKPMFVNCSFGYNPHTTRCFAWVTKGYRDEFLRYRKQGDTEWITIESFKAGDGRKAIRNRNNSIYNRIRSKTTDGTYFTAHKCIIDLYDPSSNGPATEETWEYQVGYEDNWTKIKTFTLRNRQAIIDNGFKFVLVTDLQGFNQEEYEEWKVVSDYINKHYCGAYSYEAEGNNVNAPFYRIVPEATVTSPEEIFLFTGYYKLTKVDDSKYKYEEIESNELPTNLVAKCPAATSSSAAKIYVGDVWKWETDKYVDVQNEDAKDFVWPESTNYDIVTEIPSAKSKDYLVKVTYYLKVLEGEEKFHYEYQTTTETSDVKVNGLPEEVSADDEPIILVGSTMKKKLNNIEFTINTGDATLNGNRINEWIDYFNAGDSLFSHLEQLYSVGNNDLCPVIPYELGLGGDTTKANPINVNYFFTYEHPYNLPVSATGVYIPCVYSYIYGNTYFLCMNSEITDAKSDDTLEASLSLFGQQGGILYQTIKAWCEEDLTHALDINWKIAFCHENPFTLLIKAVLDSYKNSLSTNPNYTLSHRGDVTSHLNSPGNFWFSKFLEDNHFHLSICGHKHTYTTSRYLHDNELDRMKPYVYDPNGDNAEFITLDNKYYMKVTNDSSKWYVKYTMCQASGYKLVSNKELPYYNIGWLEEYYPTDGSNKSSGLLYPHFIIWEIGKGTETENPAEPLAEARERIIGKVKKLYPTSAGSLAAGSNKLFNYNSRVFNADLASIAGGNGDTNPNNNIIVIKLPYTTDTTPLDPDVDLTTDENEELNLVNE